MKIAIVFSCLLALSAAKPALRQHSSGDDGPVTEEQAKEMIGAMLKMTDSFKEHIEKLKTMALPNNAEGLQDGKNLIESLKWGLKDLSEINSNYKQGLDRLIAEGVDGGSCQALYKKFEELISKAESGVQSADFWEVAGNLGNECASCIIGRFEGLVGTIEYMKRLIDSSDDTEDEEKRRHKRDLMEQLRMLLKKVEAEKRKQEKRSPTDESPSESESEEERSLATGSPSESESEESGSLATGSPSESESEEKRSPTDESPSESESEEKKKRNLHLKRQNNLKKRAQKKHLKKREPESTEAPGSSSEEERSLATGSPSESESEESGSLATGSPSESESEESRSLATGSPSESESEEKRSPTDESPSESESEEKKKRNLHLKRQNNLKKRAQKKHLKKREPESTEAPDSSYELEAEGIRDITIEASAKAIEYALGSVRDMVFAVKTDFERLIRIGEQQKAQSRNVNALRELLTQARILGEALTKNQRFLK